MSDRKVGPSDRHPAQTAAARVITIGLFVLLIFIVVVAVFALTTVDFTIAVVGYGIALLAAVALVVVALSFFGLSDKAQALGLPDGSVRAIIALLLIVVFAILSVHFFDDLNGRAKIQANADLAKQIVTILGTLVTAIASFYFGSAAVASATKASSSPAPAITSITPTSAATGTKVPVTVNGTNLLHVDNVRLVRGGATIGGSNVMSNATSVTCSFDIDATAEMAKWDVTVETPDKQTATLSAAFDVAGPKPALSAIDPTTGEQGQNKVLVTVAGSNLQLVNEVRLTKDDKTISVKPDSTSNDAVKATIDIPKDAAEGPWDLVVSTSDHQSATLTGKFEVKKPPTQ